MTPNRAILIALICTTAAVTWLGATLPDPAPAQVSAAMVPAPVPAGHSLEGL